MVQSDAIFRRPVVAFALALGVIPLRGFAQVQEDRSQAETTDQLLARGVALRVAGQDEAALALFSAARDRCRCSEALAQIALAELALGRWLLAEQHIGEALREGGTWIEATRRELEGEQQRIAAHLTWFEINVYPAASRVFVDGRALSIDDRRRARVRVEPGELRVRVEAPGYVPAERIVTATAGTTVRLNVALAANVLPSTTQAVIPRSAGRSHTDPPLRAIDFVLLSAAAGVSIAGGVGVGWGQQRWSEYNDDSLCLVAGRTREENCGVFRHEGDIAMGSGVAALSSGIATAIGVFVSRAMRSRALRPTPALSVSTTEWRTARVVLFATF
jgi:hypothetical protein